MTMVAADLVLSLVVVPVEGRLISPEEFLERVGVSDGSSLASEMLHQALKNTDAEEVELALIVGSTFGISRGSTDDLLALAEAGWHQRHEDVVNALAQLEIPEAVPALLAAAQHVPEYLDFDESRALARKAIHGLARIDDPSAALALAELLDNEDALVRSLARRVLARRNGGVAHPE